MQQDVGAGRARVEADTGLERNLTGPAKELYELMCSISKAATCARWMDNLEVDLWKVANGSTTKYRSGDLQPAQIEALQRLSAEAGGWIVFSGNGPALMPMQRWRESFEVWKNAPESLE